MKKKRILICIPCYQYAECDAIEALWNMKIPEDCEVDIKFIRGYTVVLARKASVKCSLEGNYDYTFFIDSDVVVPKDTLVKLMKTEADISVGCYCRKYLMNGEKVVEIFNYGMGNLLRPYYLRELPKNILLPVEGCGFGCVLIDNKLFAKIKDGVYFEYLDPKPEENFYGMGEDTYFIQKAKSVGAKIICDTSVLCGHIGKATF